MIALGHMAHLREGIRLVTFPGEMGNDAARGAGFSPEVIGSVAAGATTGADTRRAAVAMRDLGAELIVFAGGDGTARDIHDAIGSSIPTLGIPAGVKIHSAAYAINPASAGKLAARYVEGAITTLREVEVMDLDEDAYRQGIVAPRLYGYLKTPFEQRLMQARKSPSSLSESAALDAIAHDIVNQMADGLLYIVGPGTTTRPILTRLGLDKTLIGVDVVKDGKLVAADANQARLLELVKDQPTKIVVTPIGGQGYMFGRGNQQIGPDVIRAVGKEQLLVAATMDKILSLGGRPFLVDSGDQKIDALLAGYIRVITGYNERMIYRVSAGEE
jgi:predicted polyphosphate/ATP-dependent NAD kinase